MSFAKNDRMYEYPEYCYGKMPVELTDRIQTEDQLNQIKYWDVEGPGGAVIRMRSRAWEKMVAENKLQFYTSRKDLGMSQNPFPGYWSRNCWKSFGTG